MHKENSPRLANLPTELFTYRSWGKQENNGYSEARASRWLYSCSEGEKPSCVPASVTITLVDLQFEAQNSYLITYNTFIKILNMFRALPYSSSGGLRRNCIYVASSIVTVSR
jgi:hypothetical protein